MTTLMLTEEQKERHLITRLDAAEYLTFKQLTHAKAALVRAGLSPDDSTLLGAALQAIISNLPPDVEGRGNESV
jgi:ethanolamine ammonia-lyase small subunit